MVTVSIAGMEVPAERASQGWVNQMIAEARKRGVPLCVRVDVNTGDVQLSLTTPACGPGTGGGRPLTRKEQRIVDAWIARGLTTDSFAPGDVVAFLQQLSRLI